MISDIVLGEPAAANIQIVQLYAGLELYSAGEPPHQTLFVLARPPLAVLAGDADQLLLIDPPLDASQRFRLPANVAVLFTGPPQAIGLPQVQTTPGGVAHIRLGDHLLDIYSQSASTVVHLPAVGILCGGAFGSDVTLPQLAPDADGGEELDTLRLLARLVKGGRLQLYVPAVGTLSRDPADVMTRLANDVAYLHSLRRVAPTFAERKDNPAVMGQLIDSLLPSERRSPLCRTVHEANVRRLCTHVAASR
jgi:hypothetical protein